MGQHIGNWTGYTKVINSFLPHFYFSSHLVPHASYPSNPYTSMEQQTALDRFKDVPELITLVASYLYKEDLIFQLTSRKIYPLTHLLRFRQVSFNFRSHLSDFKQAAEHAQHITSLTLDEEYFVSYYSALIEVSLERKAGSSLEQSRLKTCLPASRPTSSSSSSSLQLPNHAQLDAILGEKAL